jgi:hypothetical protein
MLEEEFGQGGQTPEQIVTAASLRGIRGRHRSEILALFKAMALIPEDVQAPPEVLAMMCEADVAAGGAGGSRPTVLNLRRWLKTLQDLSLVLGTVDKPSLHDIPRDFVIGQHSVEKLRQAHHRMVEIVRGQRPSNGRGWALSRDDHTSVYVCNEISHHIELGWDLARFAEDRAAVRWLNDFTTRQVAVPLAAAHVLGVDRTVALAQLAEAAGELWLASLRWAAASHVVQASSSSVSSYTKISCLRSSAAALDRIGGTREQCTELDKSRLSLTVICGISFCWDPKDLPIFVPRMEALMGSEARKESPELLYKATVATKAWPAVVAGEWTGICTQVRRLALMMIEVANRAGDEAEKSKHLCVAHALNVIFFEPMIAGKKYD